MTKMLYGKFVQSLADAPRGEHWAILEYRTIRIPGDLRSRQAPGHGYPEHDESSISYEAFSTEADFMTVFQRRIQSPHNRERLLGIHVKGTFEPATVVTMRESALAPPAQET